MDRVLGILNLYDSPKLGKLTKKHTYGAVSFLGRYALMDFALSNFTNSGIDRIDILIEEGIQKIKNHIKNGNTWVNNTKKGFLNQYFNEDKINTPENTDVNNILENRIDEKESGDVVIIAPAHFIMSIDYRPYIKQFNEGNMDIATLYCSTDKAGKNFMGCRKFVDDNGMIKNPSFVKKEDRKACIALDTFIIKTSIFKKIINLKSKVKKNCTFKDLVVEAYKNKKIKFTAMKFDGYVAPILSFKQFVKESQNLLDYHNRKKLILENWPILTTTHNTPPALYGKTAEVKNSFVANGSLIYGTVVDSILGRDVVVEEGAVVKNSILFTGTQVKKGCVLENVVSDKKVTIQNKNIKGTKETFEFVSK